MLKIKDSYNEIMDSIEEKTQENKKYLSFSEKVHLNILKYIYEALSDAKDNAFISTEIPENFTSIKSDVLTKNFKPPEHSFFVSFNIYYHDYIGEQQYRQDFPSAFLSINASTKNFEAINKLLNRNDSKDIIIPFFKIDGQWIVSVYGLSYNFKQAELFYIFPSLYQNMEIQKEDREIKQGKHYFSHYYLELFKKITLINFNKNVDHIHIPSKINNEMSYKIPHIFLKKEKTTNSEQWLIYHKYDKEKIFHIKNTCQHSLLLK